jgi:hypothetical protein
MDPNAVRFSQASIAYRFKDRTTIDDLAAGLNNGSIRPEDVEPLRLVEREGVLYTLDNRRLEAFRRAGIQIPWRMATEEEIVTENWKFTTTNHGLAVRIRGLME